MQKPFNSDFISLIHHFLLYFELWFGTKPLVRSEKWDRFQTKMATFLMTWKNSDIPDLLWLCGDFEKNEESQKIKDEIVVFLNFNRENSILARKYPMRVNVLSNCGFSYRKRRRPIYRNKRSKLEKRKVGIICFSSHFCKFD